MTPRRTLLLALVCALAAVASTPGLAQAAPKVPVTTISQYEHSTVPATLDTQGCNAGKAGKTGLVILDFGRPAYKNKAYGTLDFSGTFQWNVSINKAVEAYITGYVRCRPASVKGVLSVARGTNNSCTNQDPNCCPHGCNLEPKSFTSAGYSWAVRTNQVENWVISKGWKYKARATGAIDAEPAWDPAYSATGKFVAAFSYTARHSGWKLPPLMWDFGSLEPGYWSRNQEWTIAAGGGGVNHVMPEIYYPGMAREWSDLSAYAKANHGARIKFGGVTSQWAPGVSACGYSPARGVGQLLAALKVHPGIGQASIARVTDFPCASSAKAAAAAATGVGVPPDVYGQNGVPCESIKHC